MSIAALASVLAVLSTLGVCVAASPKNTLRKNVLFIAVDDLRTDLGCYGHPTVKTPNIDRLAKSGVLFESTYCQQAVCSPSRTSLLTGLRPDSTKVYDLVTHFRDNVPDVVTLPQHFKNNGYQTVGFGKIYHGSLDDAKSWSRPFGYPETGQYSNPETLKYIAKRKAEAKKKKLKGKARVKYSKGPATECYDADDSEYKDGEIADRAIAALRELKDGPFFLAAGFVKPHLPFTCPKKYWDMYDRDKIKPADNPYMPKNSNQYSGTTWGELRAYSDIPKDGPVSDEKAIELIHGYHACTSFVDAQIGRLLDELDKLGLRDDTVIVLWGDHGWKLGEHGLWAKHTNFELDTHVPMIFSAPSIKAVGKKTSALTEFVDIYPTLCELAGVPVPGHLEGTSVVPLLNDPELSWKSAAFSQYPRWDVMGHAMRTERYRYIEWVDFKTNKVKARELYDHKIDPSENNNIADDPEYSKIVKKLHKQMKAGWKGCVPSKKSRQAN
jgi:arylsulfatase A-like enzyme